MIQISGLVPDSDERGELRPSLFLLNICAYIAWAMRGKMVSR